MGMETSGVSSAGDRLRAEIAATGPVPLVSFMQQAADAYYASGRAFGQDGDFTTAPEICQVFGEIVGLWAAVVWQSMGSPSSFSLVELGPGRGVLMADVLRVVRCVPGFLEAASVHLVERSPVLRQLQHRALEAVSPHTPVSWHDGIDTLPDGPLLVLANEFFDALPIEQFEYTRSGWLRRHVTVDDVGNFVLTTAGEPVDVWFDAPDVGMVAEICPAACAIVDTLSGRFLREAGAMLLVDYGYARSAPGDTLQAVRNHAFVPPLEDPGNTDLTSHVDFERLTQVARAAGASVCGPVGQGRFLSSLGAEQRGRVLTRAAGGDSARAMNLSSGLRRLIHPSEMGSLFKVLCVHSPDLSIPPGFEFC